VETDGHSFELEKQYTEQIASDFDSYRCLSLIEFAVTLTEFGIHVTLR